MKKKKKKDDRFSCFPKSNTVWKQQHSALNIIQRRERDKKVFFHHQNHIHLPEHHTVFGGMFSEIFRDHTYIR